MLDPLGSDGCGISSRLFFSTSVSSAISRSSRVLRGSRVKGFGVSVQHRAAQFAVAGGLAQPDQLAGPVAPRLVAGEQDAVVADAAALDLGGQPARREADRPAGVGVDALAGGDP